MAIIRGYGAVFNRIVRTAEVAAFVVTKDTFSLAGRSIGFCLDHEAHRRYAATNNRSMSVWSDSWGLAFECDVHDDGVVDLVRRGAFIEASCHYHSIAHHDGSFGGEPVKFFDRATISEISVVSCGGCPDTAVWAVDTPEEHLTDHQRFSARMWRMGKFQNSRRQEGRRGGSSPFPPQCSASRPVAANPSGAGKRPRPPERSGQSRLLGRKQPPSRRVSASHAGFRLMAGARLSRPYREARAKLAAAHKRMSPAEIAEHALCLAGVVGSQDDLLRSLLETGRRIEVMTSLLVEQRTAAARLAEAIAAQLACGNALGATVLSIGLRDALQIGTVTVDAFDIAKFTPAAEMWPDIFSPKGGKQ